ncbi:hypothetical protein C3497_04585 [Zoogloeaceae bacteirum Par-f-2]|nr:hypothetical protein C3497_04585 [Zoogloeaceae bacteirum Par-f-2]
MRRLSFPVVATLASCLLALLYTVAGLLQWQNDRETLEQTLANESKTLRTTFEVALSDLEQQMLTLASMVAADPEVRHLFQRGKEAVEAEGGGPGGARAAHWREALYRHVAPAWSDMQKQYGLRQLHFQLGPGSLSFLRVHTPQKFGDRMDGLRHIIEDVNRDHQPRAGFETGRIYSGVRGVVPVWASADDGTRSFIGALEAGTSFDIPLERLERQVDAGFAVLLDQAHVEGAVWNEFRPLNGTRQPDGCQCYLEAASREEVRAWMAAELLPRMHATQAVSHLLHWAGKDWHLTRFPLRDYLGSVDPAREPVGSVLIWRDKSATLAAWRDRQQTMAVQLVLAFLLSLGLLLGLLHAARRRLQQRIAAATAALRVSEDMLQRAQSVAQLGSWSIDAESGRLTWSLETYRIFGLPPGTQVDYPFFLEHVHPEDRAMVDAAWRAALAGAAYDIEHRIVVDGDTRWVRERAELVRDQHGRLRSALGTVQDVTALKRAELALRASEERYRITFAAVEDGLWDWHIPTNAVHWDAHSFQMLGYPENAFPVTLETWQKLLHPEDLQRFSESLRRQLAHGGVFVGEFRYRRADGGWLWIQSRGKVVDWMGEEPVRMVGTHSDISARKGAEEALLTARARLATVIENFHGGILLEDERRTVQLTNQMFCDLFAPFERPDTLVGKAAEAVLDASADRFQAPMQFRESTRQLVASRQAKTGEELLLSDGRALERDSLPIVDGGRFLGHLWLYRDITERKTRERELHRLATTDLLTGLPNRRYFLERVEQELGRLRRFGTPAALLMMDIDHFKQVNDLYGHPTGDAVLRHFAEVAGGNLRRIDLLGRLGGEEFAALLPGTDADGARLLAERLRLKIADAPCVAGKKRVKVTVSIGITLLHAGDTGSDRPLARADAALYRAKRAGRNRVEAELQLSETV